MLSMIQTQQKPDPATLPHVEEHIQIPVRDGSKIAARIYKPKETSSDGSPGFIVFHGGGYAVGGLETEAWLCALFTSLGGVTVDVDYRLAPDHTFPTAINDAFDATKWVRVHRFWYSSPDTHSGLGCSKCTELGNQPSQRSHRRW
jgi:acetyl esterase/lipase